MLRISENHDDRNVVLKIEGRLIEPWVMALDDAWRSLEPALGTRRLSVDLRGVVFVNESGRKVLKKIVRATGADLIADSPLTRYFANEVRQTARKPNEEN